MCYHKSASLIHKAPRAIHKRKFNHHKHTRLSCETRTTSLPVKEMQIQSTFRYHFPPFQNCGDPVCHWGCGRVATVATLHTIVPRSTPAQAPGRATWSCQPKPQMHTLWPWHIQFQEFILKVHVHVWELKLREIKCIICCILSRIAKFGIKSKVHQ